MTGDASTSQLSLHALRALGIFFIRGAIASLVGLGIAALGYVILIVGGASPSGGVLVLGGIVVGIGVLVGFGWQVVVVIAAYEELRKSGVK